MRTFKGNNSISNYTPTSSFRLLQVVAVNGVRFLKSQMMGESWSTVWSAPQMPSVKEQWNLTVEGGENRGEGERADGRGREIVPW